MSSVVDTSFLNSTALQQVLSRYTQAYTNRYATLTRSADDSANTAISAYARLLNSLQDLKTSLAGITTSSPVLMNAVVSDSSKLTATAYSSATQGTYGVAVNKVAQSDILTSKAYSSENSVVGTGTLIIRGGDSDTGVTIDITESRSTLSRIRDTLNASGAAVKASIARDDSGYRLLIAAKNSGTANSLNITVNDDDLNNSDANGLSALAYDRYGAKNMAKSQSSADTALFVNNSFYTGGSATVSDAITGVAMNLLGESGPYPVNITVSKDTNGFIFGNVDAFVKAYNNTMKLIDTLQPENGGINRSLSKGDLSGDFAVVNLKNALVAIQNKTYGGSTLKSLGFRFDFNTQNMSVDIGAINNALGTNLTQATNALNSLSSDLGAIADNYINTVIPGQQTNYRSLANAYSEFEKKLRSFGPR